MPVIARRLRASSWAAVLRFEVRADKAGVDGLVASGREVEILRKEFGDRFTLVVPGIRTGTSLDDHSRAVTPAEAVSQGADYLVIGRAVTEAKKPEAVLSEISFLYLRAISRWVYQNHPACHWTFDHCASTGSARTWFTNLSPPFALSGAPAKSKGRQP